VRTLDHTLNLTFTDVKGPRGLRGDVHRNLSGTISGTYDATVTFQRGDSYSEKTVNRTFTIELGNGDATLRIRGVRFGCDLLLGELKQLLR
jgi:hypothetical protein